MAGCATFPAKDNSVLNSYKSAVMLNYSDSKTKFKKKAIIAAKLPDKIRFEVRGFWNEPLLIIFGVSDKLTAYFPVSGYFYENSGSINTSDLLKILSGCSEGFCPITVNNKKSTAYISYDKAKETLLPKKTEITVDDIKLVVTFLDPAINEEIKDDMFEIKIPEKAKRIEKQEDFFKMINSLGK